MGNDIRKSVKEHYGKVAEEKKSCCCGDSAETQSVQIGYSAEDLQTIPDGANLGLGCGNPLAFAEIKTGDTVLDLGSGAGIDCFLAAKKVGQNGKVIGIDMTESMVNRANEYKEKSGVTNVDFRLGHIEDLPVESNSVNLVISNCVINLSPNKPKVFQEIFRVLKSGGMIMVSDIVLRKKLPKFIKNNASAYMNCVAGASLKFDYIQAIADARFEKTQLVESVRLDSIFPKNNKTFRNLIQGIPLPYFLIKKLSGIYAESIKIKTEKPKLA